ncbi:MAG: saccharopine dehydrogenase family protein [Terriglobia bacterium]
MRILVLGAGRMGGAIVYDLLRSPAVRAVGVADKSRAALARLARRFRSRRLRLHPLDATDEKATIHLLRRYQAAASALPYWQNVPLTRAAIRAGVPLCDLGGSHAARAAQQRFHAATHRRGITILPDCGLAPGIASVLAAHGAGAFERLRDIQIRVGGLPRRPQPPLGYALYFSPEGLINEYTEPVEIVMQGRRRRVAPLTGLEPIRFRGLPPLEAFYTSGGSSTLPHYFRGVRTLEEKTIRYRGHCQEIRVLKALGLFSSRPCSFDGRPVRPRELLASLLEETLPREEPDVVLLRVALTGRTHRGARRKLIYELCDFYHRRSGLTAMMRTTAFPASIAVQWLAQGILPPGVHSPETGLPPAAFLKELGRRGIRIERRWARP